MPDPAADALLLEQRLGVVVRALHQRYPNLQQVFLSSRTYGGYAEGTLNPEPFAYEGAFAVKWPIGAQIQQAQTGRIDSVAGNLNLGTAAPWLAWGPYLWANGTTPRADGLVWLRENFSADGIHPSRSGEEKVARLLLDFFRTSSFTRCWFLAGQRRG